MRIISILIFFSWSYALSETNSFSAKNYTLHFTKSDSTEDSEMVTIYSASQQNPSLTIEYLSDGSSTMLVKIDIPGGSVIYEDTDGDGVYDRGIFTDDTLKKFRVFTVNFEKVFLEPEEAKGTLKDAGRIRSKRRR